MGDAERPLRRNGFRSGERLIFRCRGTEAKDSSFDLWQALLSGVMILAKRRGLLTRHRRESHLYSSLLPANGLTVDPLASQENSEHRLSTFKLP